jgi:hypothetical protein
VETILAPTFGGISGLIGPIEHPVDRSHFKEHCGAGHFSGSWHFQSHLGSAHTDSQTGSGHVILHLGGLQIVLHCGQLLVEHCDGGQMTVQSGSSQVSKQPSSAICGQRVSHLGAWQSGSQTSSQAWEEQAQLQTG